MSSVLTSQAKRVLGMALTERALLAFLALAIYAVSPIKANAQVCEQSQVFGSVTIGDGSIPPYPNEQYQLWVCCDDCGCAGLGSYPYGGVTIPLGGPLNVPDGEYKFSAYTGFGPWSPYDMGSGVSCWNESGCTKCGGSFSITVWSCQGAMDGFVTHVPSGEPAEGAAVGGAYGPDWIWNVQLGTTDSAGYYLARTPNQPNNWGVAVDCDGWGPGSRAYRVSTPGATGSVDTTVTSNVMSRVDLFIAEPWLQEPLRGCAVGEPVDVATGNVFFDHVDADIPSVGQGLRFARSYNSRLAYDGKGGVFGPGWFHTYEQTLSVPATDYLELILADGEPLYFEDADHDLTYRAAVPATETSWILKTGTEYTRRFLDGRTEVYSLAGELQDLTDAVGNQTVLTRVDGRITQVSDGPRSLSFTYTGSGSGTRLETVSGPAGLIASYLYSIANRLETVTYPDQTGYSFIYDGNGQVLTVKDGADKIIESHLYEGNRGTTSEISDNQEKLTLEYAENKTTVTDALGNVATYHWTYTWGRRAVTRVEGCTGCTDGAQSSEWTYDVKGRKKTYKDGSGAITTYTYDEATGELVSEMKPLGHETTYTYWPWPDGRLHTRTAPNGAVTTYTYVAAGPNIITETIDESPAPLRTIDFDYWPEGFPGEGKVKSIVDPRGKKTEFTYDPTFGDLATVTNPLGTETPDPNDHVTRFEYDELGRRTAVINPLGHRTETAYDARSNVLYIRQFDDARPIDTTFTYTPGGRRKTVTDGNGHITEYEYDPYGRLWKVFQPLDELGVRPVTTYGYDDMSNLTSITDAESRTTTFLPDEYNRVEKVTYPGPREEDFTYDTSGRLKTRTRGGVTTTYGYDALNRLTSKVFTDGTPPHSYIYDENGDVGFLTSASTNGRALAWDYDLAGQVKTEIASATGAPSSTVAYTYDLAGSRQSVALNGEVWLTYDYDDASRLDKIWRGAMAFDFGYDDAHRRQTLDYPNLVHIGYGYDTMSRLLSLTVTRNNVTLGASVEYTYDDAGNRITKSQPGALVEEYDYDPLDRLLQVTRNGIGSEQYTYDKVGNRNPLTWIYNERNELISNGTRTLTYDLRGNRTTKVEGVDTWLYEWNAENQLTRVVRNGTEVARYTYDPLGRRVEKVVGTDVHAWVYDGEDILQESEGGIITSTMVHGPGIDEPLSREPSPGAALYAHADGLGSVIKVTNSAGAVIYARQYDAFGNLEIGSGQGSYAFTGREWEPETGLYYYRARYYDPKIGRFISEDPIRFAGGLNFYAYVDNNPANFTDAFGLVKGRICLSGSAVRFGGADASTCFECELTPNNFTCSRVTTASAGAGWNTSVCVSGGMGSSGAPPVSMPEVTHNVGGGPFAASATTRVRGNSTESVTGLSLGLQWPPTPSYSAMTPISTTDKGLFNLADTVWRNVNRQYCSQCR